jgi:hypothetical protein
MMNDSTRVSRQPGRAWRRVAQTAGAVIVLAALTVPAGCSSPRPSSAGSGGSPQAAGAASSRSAVAYSACMRAHGVPKFPDPGSDGGIPKGDAQHFEVSSSQLQAAQQACQSLLPVGGSLQDQAHDCIFAGVCPAALVQQMETAMRQFAQCMRSHGFPTFPDPTTDAQGRPELSWSVSQTGIDPHSSRYQTQEDECQRLGGLGGPRVVRP